MGLDVWHRDGVRGLWVVGGVITVFFVDFADLFIRLKP
jgi:hypothetical protein